MRPLRLHTPLDQFLIETQRALETVFGSPAAWRRWALSMPGSPVSVAG